MRLRRPCEHDRYDAHRSFNGYNGAWGGYETCPGGEFLPEDAELVRTISEHFMAALAPFRSEMKAGDLVAVCNAHARQVLDALNAP